MMSYSKRLLIQPAVYAIFVLLLSSILWAAGGAIAVAAEIGKTVRTVPLNASGEQITLTTKQLAIGQRKFNGSCAQCHIDGSTKTNPDVDLGAKRLALAIPPRNNIESMVEYLENPTTYDGLTSIAELHPSLARSDLFPKMRDLTNDDLAAIAGYILIHPKVLGDQWAGGKPTR